MTMIIGLKLSNRISTSPVFQNIISKYGCIINTRIGLHSNCSRICSSYGIILLEIVDNSNVIPLKKELLDIDGITLDTLIL